MTTGTAGRRTRARRGLLAAALVVTLGATALLLPGALGGQELPAPPPAPRPYAALLDGLDREPFLLPPLTGRPVPPAAGVQQVVAQALRDPALGGSLAVSVLDAATGAVLLEDRAEQDVLPASTVKIATAVAALTALPPTARLSTRVLAGAEPGEVVLVGGGDTLLAGPGAEPSAPAPARLTDLAAQVLEASAGPVRRVLVDDGLYSGPRLAPGWKPSYVSDGDVAPVSALSVDGGRARPDRPGRVQDPALSAGRALAALLDAGTRLPVTRGAAPQGALTLGEVRGAQVPALVETMLGRSDNDLAESLARQVALSQGLPATFAGAAEAVEQVLGGVLEDVGLDRGAFTLADGSGLSRLDRVRPGALTRLLAAVADGRRPALLPLLSGLPVAGFDGTLARRFRSGPSSVAAGTVRGKTGTLSGVSALAGVLRTSDGALLAFALTADAVPAGENRAAERALDVLAARLASCGCRSVGP